MITKGKLIELIYKSFPNADQIKELDLDLEADAIRFNWRGTVFRVGTELGVNSVKGMMICGCDLSSMAEALLKRTFAGEIQQ